MDGIHAQVSKAASFSIVPGGKMEYRSTEA